MMLCMKLSRSLRKLGEQVEQAAMPRRESHLVRTFGWVSAGVAAVALGVVVGRELRQRYKFNHRTPYDMYAHSGDRVQDVDFGVGI
jgi:hypothetical protein